MRRQDHIRIEVEELVLVESGTYSDQYLRPYVTQVTGDITDRVEERFHKHRRFTPAVLADIANQFMVPDHNPRGIIDIPNGWSTRRGRFILTLHITTGTSDVLKQIVMGYTNAVGFTTSKTDPDLEFFVNSTFMLREQTIRTSRGYSRMWVPVNPNEVLSDHDNAGLRRRGPQLYTTRPEDVYSSIDAEQTMELVDDVTDLRTTLNRNAIKSKMTNRLSSHFMSNVLSTRQKAIDNTEYGNSVVDINASAQSYAAEDFVSDDQFLRRMADIRGTTVTEDFFLFRDLERMDPNTDNRTERQLFNQEAKAQTRYEDATGAVSLGSSDVHDQIAALINISIPALMMECGIHQINFHVDNDGAGGFLNASARRFIFTPNNVQSFIKDMDMTIFIDRFEERLIDELLVPISFGDISIGIDMQCRIFGECDFRLFYDGRNCGRYITPVFTSSVASPIITDDRNDVKRMAKNFSSLFDHFLPADGMPDMDGPGRNYNF